MPFLITAVVLVGLLCALDLVLGLGVIKRLREHTEMLNNLNGRPPSAPGRKSARSPPSPWTASRSAETC